MKILKKIVTLLFLVECFFYAPLTAHERPIKSSYIAVKTVTVYITKTGKKYHLSDCSYLRLSKISIDKEKAIGEGYTACSRCKP